MMMAQMIETRPLGTLLMASLLAALSMVVCVWQEAEARDLFAPKEQVTTEVDPTQSPSFDEQKKGIPQSLFTWIKMAKGYDIEWDTFGRKGWYTQDPRLKPVEPGSVFPRDIPAIYIVFESAPLEDPAQFSAQWFLEGEKGVLSPAPLGKEAMPEIDRVLGNWYTSAHPESHFRNRLIVARATAEGRVTLANRELGIRRREGQSESRLLGSPEELLAVLAEHFDLHFPAGTRFPCPALEWPRD